MDEEVVNGFLSLFAKTTPINKGKNPASWDYQSWGFCPKLPSKWRKQYEVEPSPSRHSSKEIDKTIQTVVKCNNSSHQTHWVPAGIHNILFVSLGWVFEEYNISRNATRDSSS